MLAQKGRHSSLHLRLWRVFWSGNKDKVWIPQHINSIIFYSTHTGCLYMKWYSGNNPQNPTAFGTPAPAHQFLKLHENAGPAENVSEIVFVRVRQRFAFCMKDWQWITPLLEWYSHIGMSNIRSELLWKSPQWFLKFQLDTISLGTKAILESPAVSRVAADTYSSPQLSIHDHHVFI